MKAEKITGAIGNTPLIELRSNVWAKLERANPGGSVKDRIALAMIEDAERRGVLKKGGTIIEPTSGNTGVGLAMVGTVRGYRVILTMPESMTIERRKLLQAYGAELILTPASEGMRGAIEKAKTIDGVMLDQFSNPANPAAHYNSTGVEIWRDTAGAVDIFVAGVGTGGTISGVGKRLKENNSNVKIVAVQPDVFPHKIQGIGPGFVPANYDAKIVDEVIEVSSDDAMKTARELSQKHGLLVGISSGAAAWAAFEIAARPENVGKTIVTLLPDTGERYLSIIN